MVQEPLCTHADDRSPYVRMRMSISYLEPLVHLIFSPCDRRILCNSNSRSKADYISNNFIQYSQLSANGHSHKRTALLTDAFSSPRFTSQSNSVVTHSRKRTLSRKRTRTLLKMKIQGFFFCLRSLVSGHPMYNN